MSKRSRARKEQREREKREFWDTRRAIQREQTAWLRRTAAWLGLGLAGIVVVFGLVMGGIRLYQTYAPMSKVSGPFGSITRAELGENQFATLQTSEGDIKLELDIKNTPKTAANFILLTQKGFYEGVKFHRAIEDFMIQGGDPNSKDDDPTNDGQGGPGYQFDNEPVVGEYTRGTLAMANAGPNTNGSQFFIMHKDTNLPKDYVIFGRVVEGLAVVDKIATAPVVEDDNGEASRPKQPVVINKIILSNQ